MSFRIDHARSSAKVTPTRLRGSSQRESADRHRLCPRQPSVGLDDLAHGHNLRPRGSQVARRQSVCSSSTRPSRPMNCTRYLLQCGRPHVDDDLALARAIRRAAPRRSRRRSRRARAPRRWRAPRAAALARTTQPRPGPGSASVARALEVVRVVDGDAVHADGRSTARDPTSPRDLARRRRPGR